MELNEINSITPVTYPSSYETDTSYTEYPIKQNLRLNRSNTIVRRLNAVESSNWTHEELKLLKTWEEDSSCKSRVHSKWAIKYQKRSKWLKFITGMVATLSGGSGCVTFFVKLSYGDADWSELIFNFLSFLAGLTFSISDSFEWQKLFNDHDGTASEYKKNLF